MSVELHTKLSSLRTDTDLLKVHIQSGWKDTAMRVSNWMIYGGVLVALIALFVAQASSNFGYGELMVGRFIGTGGGVGLTVCSLLVMKLIDWSQVRSFNKRLGAKISELNLLEDEKENLAIHLIDPIRTEKASIFEDRVRAKELAKKIQNPETKIRYGLNERVVQCILIRYLTLGHNTGPALENDKFRQRCKDRGLQFDAHN